MRLVLHLVLMTLALALAACGGDDESEPGGAGTTSGEVRERPAPRADE